MNWYLKCLKQYADFSGRARRKEFWMFTLFNAIFGFVFGFIDGLLGWTDPEIGLGVLSGIYSLAVLVPGVAVTVRRLHDVGMSGWKLLYALIPIVGPIILLVSYCTAGDSGSNKWGPDPKMVVE